MFGICTVYEVCLAHEMDKVSYVQFMKCVWFKKRRRVCRDHKTGLAQAMDDTKEEINSIISILKDNLMEYLNFLNSYIRVWIMLVYRNVKMVKPSKNDICLK